MYRCTSVIDVYIHVHLLLRLLYVIVYRLCLIYYILRIMGHYWLFSFRQHLGRRGGFPRMHARMHIRIHARTHARTHSLKETYTETHIQIHNTTQLGTYTNRDCENIAYL